jgi:hypothetical protein
VCDPTLSLACIWKEFGFPTTRVGYRLYYLFYGLFSDAVSTSVCKASSDGMLNE